jgi:tetratricopeptide (TPR) repeat protein
VGAGEWGEGAAMTTTLKIEDFDLPPETEDEVYASLLRALRRKQGFGLFFVQCTPAQGQDVMARLREDLGGKRLATVQVGRETTTLYDEVEALWEREPFDVLFVQGLEQALYGYEDTKRLMGWTSEEVYSYSWRGVPPILNHLNQRRDKLRNHFPACFVFLVPVFVVDYFLQRAADFLDWRSGLFILPRDPESLAQDIEEALVAGNYEEYLKMPSAERRELILELKNLYLSCNDIAKGTDILFKLGHLFRAEGDYVSAILSWGKLLENDSNNWLAWFNRGSALQQAGRSEEAISSYDKSIEINPSSYPIYSSRGLIKYTLGDYQNAIYDCDQAIKLESSDYISLTIRGYAYAGLRNYQRAIADYNEALKIAPYYLAYHGRGHIRSELEDYEGAILDYDEAAKIEPSDFNIYFHRGNVKRALDNNQGAMTDYDQAIKLNPNDADTYYNRGISQHNLGNNQTAISDYQKAADLYKQQGRIEDYEDTLNQIKKLR